MSSWHGRASAALPDVCMTSRVTDPLTEQEVFVGGRIKAVGPFR